MRVQATLFAGALILGVAFDIASAPRVALSDGGEMVQYTQSIAAQLPDGSISSPSTNVFTVSAARERIDGQFGTYVIECDRQRTITWQARMKSFVVESFDQMAQQYAKIDVDINKSGELETMAPVHDAPDAKTMVIDGIIAHHLVQTVATSPKGAISPTVIDAWYAPGADPFVCPAFDAITPHGPRVTTSSSNGGSVTTSFVAMGTLEGAHPTGSIVLRESIRIEPGLNVMTKVTAIRTLPYDPTYFEPPPNFVQVSPRPMPSLPRR